MVLTTTKTAEKQIHLIDSEQSPIGLNVWVRADSPARVDLSGGWTDTPPICCDLGGRVCGVAINFPDEDPPIGCESRRIPQRHILLSMKTRKMTETIEMKTFDDLRNYCDPRASGALLKAAIVFSGLVDQNDGLELRDYLDQRFESGLEIRTKSLLPEGSGLGTSSILAGCILSTLWTLMRKKFVYSDLIHGVLMIEQILTTGGGWQDQVNGLWPGGIKLGSSPRSEDLIVSVETFDADDVFHDKLGRHLLLVFTGKVRLAKNLLQTVVRGWYTASDDIAETMKANRDLGFKCWSKCLQGDLEGVGECLNAYWRHKKLLAGEGAEPTICSEIMKATAPACLGQSMAGAGGGGFLVLLLKTSSLIEEVSDIVLDVAKNRREFGVFVQRVQVDREGLRLQIGQQDVNIEF